MEFPPSSREDEYRSGWQELCSKNDSPLTSNCPALDGYCPRRMLRFSLSGECLENKDMANGTDGKKGSRRLQRNRHERASKLKSGESKLGSCMDKVTWLKPLRVTMSEILKCPAEIGILTRMTERV